VAETGSREAPLPGFEGLVGQSPAMQALFRRLARLAVVDVSVLILGESGTGKELVAAALHRLSPRRGARFEPINCGGLSRELLRSELFGHERGAFTGAVERHAGLLREADGGTVFLDEVGELPLDAQAVLLRFLGNGEVRPVGLTRTLHVDVRVIATIHRDLATAIERGLFREDVYYRLREVVLQVPPLRIITFEEDRWRQDSRVQSPGGRPFAPLRPTSPVARAPQGPGGSLDDRQRPTPRVDESLRAGPERPASRPSTRRRRTAPAP
jgi:DNA-binding NtrC family response regulator